MKLNIHDWMDDWFLSLSENPDKLDEYIKRYEHARIIASIGMVIVIALLFSLIFSGKGINDNAYIFTYVMFIFMLVLNLQADTYTKFLKLQRRQQNRDTNDATPPSGAAKKNSLSAIAWTYGPALLAGALGILAYALYVMNG